METNNVVKMKKTKTSPVDSPLAMALFAKCEFLIQEQKGPGGILFWEDVEKVVGFSRRENYDLASQLVRLCSSVLKKKYGYLLSGLRGIGYKIVAPESINARPSKNNLAQQLPDSTAPSFAGFAPRTFSNLRSLHGKKLIIQAVDDFVFGVCEETHAVFVLEGKK